MCTSQVNMETQTELTLDGLNSMEKEMQSLRKDLLEIRAAVRPTSQEAFKGDDKRVTFYTGLPNFAVLMHLFSFLAPFMNKSALSALSGFQELTLFLMKLRLNMPGQDLAYRFNISQSTVSRVFNRWLDLCLTRLSWLVQWPGRYELRTSMPRVFRKNFPRCVAVIDCFEVAVERPSDLNARASLWSNYKQKNTCKYLVAITPQGSISFVSKGWGGRASDKMITEECGLLDFLIPGDQVLADRGFTIQESVGLYCAEVIVPDFTRGKKQLSGTSVERSRRIANVRIHVERVIGMIRQKYTILNGVLPVALFGGAPDKVDKIVTVCSALCSMCSSVVIQKQ